MVKDTPESQLEECDAVGGIPVLCTNSSIS